MAIKVHDPQLSDRVRAAYYSVLLLDALRGLHAYAHVQMQAMQRATLLGLVTLNFLTWVSKSRPYFLVRASFISRRSSSARQSSGESEGTLHTNLSVDLSGHSFICLSGSVQGDCTDEWCWDGQH